MFLSSFSRKLTFFFLALFLPVEVWANQALPTKAIEVRLNPSVTVSTDRVVLGDVATIYARSLQDFRQLSDLVISQIPEDKGELRIPQSYLERRIRDALPAGVEFVLHAPGEIVFKLERMGFSPTEIGAEIERLAKIGGKIPEGVEFTAEILAGADPLKLQRPDSVRVEPAAEMAQWRNDVVFKVVAKDTATPVAWVRARIRWFGNAWVAKRGVSAGQPLSPDDFQLERRELTAQREDRFAPADLGAALGSARARRGIAANGVLTAGMIERRPDAGPGQALKVIFVSENGIRVTADGALLGAGVIGNEVRAKLRTSRKIVSGRLVSGNVMEVSL